MSKDKKETQKCTFVSYYKYQFTVKGEDGIEYELDNCDRDDIYRFAIYNNDEMFKDEDGQWCIDGLPFIPM